MKKSKFFLVLVLVAIFSFTIVNYSVAEESTLAKQKEESILQETIDYRVELSRMYIEMVDKSINELDKKLENLEKEANTMEDEAKKEIDEKIKSVSAEREKAIKILEDLKQKRDEVVKRIELADSEELKPIESAYYDIFLKDKSDMDAAMKDLEKAYYEAFLK